MATMTLMANRPFVKSPDSYGDNTIVDSSLFGFMSEPRDWENLNRYDLSSFDFLEDTFPQFSHSSKLNYIQIIGIRLPNTMTFKYKDNDQDVRVGDVFDVVNGSFTKNTYLRTTTSFVDMQQGFIDYVYHVDGIGINPQAVSRINLLRFSAADNFRFNFKPSETITLPQDTSKYVFTKKDFTNLFMYNDILNPYWSVDPALRLRTIQYFNQYGGAPYKISIESNFGSRLKLFGKPIKVGQKISLGVIALGYFTIDLEGTKYFDFKFRFGNAFVGSFRLLPFH